MYDLSELELWNINPGCPALVGPQSVFNILGRIRVPDQTRALFYSLNGGPERPVFFKVGTKTSLRLEREGDFNIDTISAAELQSENSLSLRTIDLASEERRYRVNFSARFYTNPEPEFQLELNGVAHAQEVGQVVDGKWQIGRDECGERCLEVSREDAGYDRIILFGSQEWTSGYEITARISVTGWTGIRDHGVGVAFKWNPHLQGDGTRLPFEWNTGVGMYYSKAASLRAPLGLRVAFGVTANNGNGTKFSHYLLKQRPLSLWRKEFSRISRPIIGANHLFSQIPPNKQYRFRMKVRPEQFALTVWRDGKKEPLPRLDLPQPIDRLPRGAVGIIAHHCAVRVYEFAVSPIQSVRQSTCFLEDAHAARA